MRKHPVSRANNGNTKIAVMFEDFLCLKNETLSTTEFSTNFDIYYNMLDQIIESGE